jgi:hypothetical protein
MGFLNLEKPILRNEFRAPGRTVPEELRSWRRRGQSRELCFLLWLSPVCEQSISHGWVVGIYKYHPGTPWTPLDTLGFLMGSWKAMSIQWEVRRDKPISDQLRPWLDIEDLLPCLWLPEAEDRSFTG